MIDVAKVRQEQENGKNKLKEILDNVPPIHWEILKYSNTHNREETLKAYPEYFDFINSIIYQ